MSDWLSKITKNKFFITFSVVCAVAWLITQAINLTYTYAPTLADEFPYMEKINSTLLPLSSLLVFPLVAFIAQDWEQVSSLIKQGGDYFY